MKKLVMVFIFIVLFSQFAFSGEVNVSSFIGAYTGYSHKIVNNYSYNYHDRELNNLMFGISARFGLSDKILDDLTLYYLCLFDLGSFFNFTQGVSLFLFDEIIMGGEIKLKYKRYFLGLASGMGFFIFPSRYFFLRQSFGYNIKQNLLLDIFVDLENIGVSPRENINFRLGFTFYIFKFIGEKL